MGGHLLFYPNQFSVEEAGLAPGSWMWSCKSQAYPQGKINTQETLPEGSRHQKSYTRNFQNGTSCPRLAEQPVLNIVKQWARSL